MVKNPSANAGDMDLIPGSGRCPGEGNGNPATPVSWLENSMDRGAWWAIVHEVTKEMDTIYWLNNSNKWYSRKNTDVGFKYFGLVQSLSHIRPFVTPWTTALQASLSITNSWSLPKLMSIESMMLSNHLILCYPLFLLPSVFPSIRVFSDESVLHVR